MPDKTPLRFVTASGPLVCASCQQWVTYVQSIPNAWAPLLCTQCLGKPSAS